MSNIKKIYLQPFNCLRHIFDYENDNWYYLSKLKSCIVKMICFSYNIIIYKEILQSFKCQHMKLQLYNGESYYK